MGSSKDYLAIHDILMYGRGPVRYERNVFPRFSDCETCDRHVTVNTSHNIGLSMLAPFLPVSTFFFSRRTSY